MNTATSGLGFRHPKLRCESCRVLGISAREAFPALSMPGAEEPGWSGRCLRYEAGFLAQEEQAEQREVVVLGQVHRHGTGHFHIPTCHISLCADLWAGVQVSAPSFALQDPKAHLPVFLACTQLPTHFSYIPFSGGSSFYPYCYYDP